eukprot:gene6552-13254_t
MTFNFGFRRELHKDAYNCGKITLNSYSDDTILECFQRSFGMMATKAHFNNSGYLRDSIDRQEIENNNNPLIVRELICTNYSTTEDLNSILKIQLGESNVQPIYISNDILNPISCFIATHSPDITITLNHLQQINYFSVPIPNEMKISPNLISILDSMNNSNISPMDNYGKDLWNRFNKDEVMLDISYVPVLFTSHERGRGPGLLEIGNSLIDVIKEKLTIENIFKNNNIYKTTSNSYSSSTSTLRYNHWDEVASIHMGYTTASTTSKLLNENLCLNGQNVIIGVSDTGIDESHCFFRNYDNSFIKKSSSKNPLFDLSKRKIIQYINDSDSVDVASGHGSHVCGTIAGFSVDNNNMQYNGVATQAKIAFYDVFTSGQSYLSVPDIYSVLFPVAASAGAVLHSNSWGADDDIYNSDCTDTDKYLYEHPNFLAIFAAGNNGLNGASTMVTPSVSKNCVAVGATGTSHGAGLSTLAYFSSKGPTVDGRFGVDVLAPGAGTYSAKAAALSSSCSIVSKSGTSMATPAVAGAAALVVQYFKNDSFWASSCHAKYPSCRIGAFQPSGSLVKTVLIHSGVDIGGVYAFPGPEQGFGRVNLQTVLYIPGITSDFNLYVEDIMMNSTSTRVYYVSITSTAKPLKVSICWMDPVNYSPTGKQLLHDADLTVTTPAGGILYGNGGNSKDTLNNVEMVNVASPSGTGVYKVTVSMGVLTNGHLSQRVSVVITSGGLVVTDTSSPTTSPTTSPSSIPTTMPSTKPTAPTTLPTLLPSAPTLSPSLAPSMPTSVPTETPSPLPSSTPTLDPSGTPSIAPISAPTSKPSTLRPSFTPSRLPTQPTVRPMTSTPTLVPLAVGNTVKKNSTDVASVSSALFFVPFDYTSTIFIVITVCSLVGLICISSTVCCCFYHYSSSSSKKKTTTTTGASAATAANNEVPRRVRPDDVGTVATTVQQQQQQHRQQRTNGLQVDIAAEPDDLVEMPDLFELYSPAQRQLRNINSGGSSSNNNDNINNTFFGTGGIGSVGQGNSDTIMTYEDNPHLLRGNLPPTATERRENNVMRMI